MTPAFAIAPRMFTHIVLLQTHSYPEFLFLRTVISVGPVRYCSVFSVNVSSVLIDLGGPFNIFSLYSTGETCITKTLRIPVSRENMYPKEVTSRVDGESAVIC